MMEVWVVFDLEFEEFLLDAGLMGGNIKNLRRRRKRE